MEAESEKWWATSYTALRWHGNVWFHCSHSVILLFLQLSVVPWWRSRAVARACPSIHYAGGRNTRVVQPPRSTHPSPTLPPRCCLEPQISLVTQHSSCVCGRNWSTPEHTFRRFCFPIKSLIVPDRVTGDFHSWGFCVTSLLCCGQVSDFPPTEADVHFSQ